MSDRMNVLFIIISLCLSGVSVSGQVDLGNNVGTETNSDALDVPTIEVIKPYGDIPMINLTKLYNERPTLNLTRFYGRLVNTTALVRPTNWPATRWLAKRFRAAATSTTTSPPPNNESLNGNADLTVPPESEYVTMANKPAPNQGASYELSSFPLAIALQPNVALVPQVLHGYYETSQGEAEENTRSTSPPNQANAIQVPLHQFINMPAIAIPNYSYGQNVVHLQSRIPGVQVYQLPYSSVNGGGNLMPYTLTSLYNSNVQRGYQNVGFQLSNGQPSYDSNQNELDDKLTPLLRWLQTHVSGRRLPQQYADDHYSDADLNEYDIVKPYSLWRSAAPASEARSVKQKKLKRRKSVPRKYRTIGQQKQRRSARRFQRFIFN